MIGLTDKAAAVAAAQDWRAANGYAGRGGVVTWYLGIIQGWSNVLRDPDHWEPGVIAVDEAGAAWVAEGGNSKNGAERWQALD